jgi:hypothetical protein
MAISNKHKYVSGKADGGDTSLVRPSNWNDEHDLTMATARMLGRTTAGTGAVEEITVGAGLLFASTSLTVTAALQTWDGKTAPSGAVVGTTDTQTLSGKTITNLILDGAINEEEFTITDGAGFSIDPSNGSLQKITLGANRTPAAAPGGWTAGKGLLLKIADGTAYTITWTTLGVTWVGGSAPTLATTGWTVVALWRDADAIYGKHIGDVA